MGHHVLSSPLPEDAFFGSSEYDEIWIEAEQKTAILLSQIQPSKRSEESRRAVINYVQRLIERELQCKVFSFGSVPLKTYLPDGDIDLTAISRHHNINDWAENVCTILEHEEHIHNSEFHVKEVKCISAEVPVVKCLVENIIVDITSNQLGGLSTLCFLEQVDNLIGRHHLFKRSIILVKAWCFYESRILGAHHGLLSTYALEVLVLYIFHVFHRSLRGPLEVLFRFLHFFSKFDWEQHCLSLWGPVPLGSLHSMTAETPQNSNGNFLLSEDFLNACREKYSTLLEINQTKTFSRKFMNLVDPLRPFNNLGRSVNSGNLVRIYSAFAYGATQLEKLLQSPKEHVSENLALFFRNTQKHCQGHRPDAGVPNLQVLAPLCNEKSRSEETYSREIAISRDLKDVVNLENRNFDEVYADKPARDNVDRASLQVDDVKQCIVNAHFDETPMNLRDKDDRARGRVCAGDSPTWSSDEIDVACKRLTNDAFSIYEKAVEKVSDSYACSETHSIDSMPTVRSFSVDADFFGNSNCNHHVSDESTAVTKLEEDLSICSLATSPSTVASVRSPEAGADEDILSEEQAVFFEGDFRDRIRTFEFRNTDAAILEGDYKTYFQNLQAGRLYQNSQNGGNSFTPHSFHSRVSAWEGPGRPMSSNRFGQSSNGRCNVPIHGGTSCRPNNILLEGSPRPQRGMGTFFPNSKSTFERDKRIYPNGVRSPRRMSGNMDSFSSLNHNAPSGFRSRSHAPRKHDGSNKARPRKIPDLKTGEHQGVLLREDDDLCNVLQSPTINIVDNFAHSFQRQVDSGLSGDQRLITMDWSPKSLDAAVVPTSGNDKHLPLEKLEIGSFGPGFLAKGLQKISAHKEQGECVSHTPRPSPCDNCLEPREAASKAGDHADQQQSCSAYHLKEEDFPPLPLVGHRELPHTIIAGRTTQGSYQQACRPNNSTYATKIVQNG